MELEDRTLPSINLGTNFVGLNFSNTTSGGVPPDPIGAVGQNHFVEAVNTTLRISSKSGGSPSTQQFSSFFSSLGSVKTLSDPSVAYDELTHRFLVGVLDFPTNIFGQVTGGSRLDFAVSSDDSTGSSLTWTFLRYDLSHDGVGINYDFADYPRVGWNADAYVFSFNMFPDNKNYDHVDTLSINKSSLTGYQVVVPNGLANFTMAPATMHGSTTGDPMWLVEGPGADSNGNALAGSTIQVVQMTNELSPSPIFQSFSVNVSAFTTPPAATQPASGGTIETNDSRILNAEWRRFGDGTERLVAAQTVGLSTDTVAHARWYVYDTVHTPPTPVDQGTLNPGSGMNTYFPSVAINSSGNLGMTYTGRG